jgi:PPOX class probable F420-dependent enzyme
MGHHFIGPRARSCGRTDHPVGERRANGRIPSVSRRDEIRMSPAEVSAYLAEERVIQVATVGPHGRPHLAPLWFASVSEPGAAGPMLVTWTYRKSQKVANLRRLPQATVLAESGDTYGALRGVSMECDVEVLEDHGATLEIGIALVDRYGGAYDQGRAAMIAAFKEQAAKRVGLVLRATRVASWDHAKLTPP